MHKRTADLFVIDILISIDRVKRYSSTLPSSEALLKNEALCSAILRELGIIGEAMNRVLQAKPLATLVQADWRDIVDFRNIVIHEYFGLNLDEVYHAIHKDLPILEQQIITLLKNLWVEESMRLTFEDTLQELNRIGRHESVQYLTIIQQNLSHPLNHNIKKR